LAAVATATKFEGKHLDKEGLTVSIKAKLNRVVRQWMDEELEKTEEAWAGNGAVDLDDVDDYKDIHYDQLEQAVESLQQNQQWEVKGLADELVSQHSLPVEKGSLTTGVSVVNSSGPRWNCCRKRFGGSMETSNLVQPLPPLARSPRCLPFLWWPLWSYSWRDV
jgi:hypothetical protein